MSNEKPRGQFRPGASGNPKGRPPKTPEERDLVAACKAKTPQALAVIEAIMLNGEKEQNRLRAAEMIIERAYGKPKQEIDAQVTGQIQTITRRVIDGRSVDDLV